jgi:hypothetical protein
VVGATAAAITIAVLLAIFVGRRAYERHGSVARVYAQLTDRGHVVEGVRSTNLASLARRGTWPDFDQRFRRRESTVPRRPSWRQRLTALRYAYFVVTTLDQQARRRHLVVAAKMRMAWREDARAHPVWTVREVGELDGVGALGEPG